jgi:hypothetical protein
LLFWFFSFVFFVACFFVVVWFGFVLLLCFVLFLKAGSCYVAQAGLELTM